MTPLDAMKQALETLEEAQLAQLPDGTYVGKNQTVLCNLRTAIAELEGAKPVAWLDKDHCILHEDERETPAVTLERMGWQPLFTHPAQSRNDIEHKQLEETIERRLIREGRLGLRTQSRDSIIEECAAVCDALRQEWARLKVGAYDGRYDMMEEAATVCEDSIRALKGK